MIERQRIDLLHNNHEINVEDLGAGSRHFKTTKRNIGDIARTSLSPLKYSMLYRSLIRRNKAQSVVELGTSLGINTLYMGHNVDARIYTFEGSSGIAGIAQELFERTRSGNISLIRGDIDKTLPDVLSQIEVIDFALMDANHRYEPTLRYFELLLPRVKQSSVIAIDDIHYSTEMARAWQAIKQCNAVYGSVDLFRCGLVFFDPSLNRQHFVLQF